MDPLRNPLRETSESLLGELVEEFDWWPVREISDPEQEEEECEDE